MHNEKREPSEGTPMRSIPMRDDVWKWLNSQDGGASGWIEKHALEAMRQDAEEEARDKERAIQVMRDHGWTRPLH